MACDNSSTDPECGPGNGPHCYDHDPACCHCGKPRPEPSTECEGGCRIYSAPPCRDPAKCSCGGEWWKHGCKHSLPPEPRCAGCGDQHGPEEHEKTAMCGYCDAGLPMACTCGPDEACGDPCDLGEEPGAPDVVHKHVHAYQTGGVFKCSCGAVRLLTEPGTEPPLTPEEEEELSEDACTCGAAGDAFVPLGHYKDCPCAPKAPEDALPPPEGPEYTPCVCGHIEPEHEVDGYCYDEKCGCVGYRTKPDFEAPPQPDRRPPYLLAYSVQGHLYEIALPGDATVATLDGRLVITHQLGPVAGICQIAPITSEEGA